MSLRERMLRELAAFGAVRPQSLDTPADKGTLHVYAIFNGEDVLQVGHGSSAT